MIAKHLQELLAHPEIAPYFMKGLQVKTEAEILLENGKTLRPDRIILEGNHATIIDFKTGKKEPFHNSQLDEYAAALKKLGYSSIQKVLIYIENIELLNLPA
jgi:CRISPR/Cas system-associated exonuclease Cas4 (RecB family)